MLLKRDIIVNHWLVSCNMGVITVYIAMIYIRAVVVVFSVVLVSARSATTSTLLLLNLLLYLTDQGCDRVKELSYASHSMFIFPQQPPYWSIAVLQRMICTVIHAMVQ